RDARFFFVSVDHAIVTGATGFVGGRVASILGAAAMPVSLGAGGWRESIAACDFHGATVLHLAARVPGGGKSEPQFQHDNVEKTRVLAQRAASGGARRLVFLSTIKVNGEETHGALRAGDAPAP